MEQGAQGSIGPKDIAGQLAGIYEDFTEAVQALGGKGKKRSGKLVSSMAKWVGGSHVVTDREQLCQKFLADVDRKSTRLNSSHRSLSRMPSSA